MKNSISIFFILFALFPQLSFCDAIMGDFYEDVFCTAKGLEQNGFEKEAATEYKRYIFLQDYSEGKHISESLQSLTKYYEKNTDYFHALKYARLQVSTATDPVSVVLAKIKEIDLTVSYFQKKEAEWNPVLNDKTNLLSDIRFYSYLKNPAENKMIRRYAWLCVLEYCIRNADDDNFKIFFMNDDNHFSFFVDDSENFLRNLLEVSKDSLISGKMNHDFKNEKLAYNLSLFPGLGQLYAGDVSDSINAFLLNSVLLGLEILSLCNFDFFDAFAIAYFLIPRFYIGNMSNARKAAHKHNIAKKQENLRQIMYSITIEKEKIISFLENLNLQHSE